MELVIVVLTLIVVYVMWDRRRHPMKRCPACRRSPGHKLSGWNSQAYGLCRRCGGKGEVRR